MGSLSGVNLGGVKTYDERRMTSHAEAGRIPGSNPTVSGQGKMATDREHRMSCRRLDEAPEPGLRGRTSLSGQAGGAASRGTTVLWTTIAAFTLFSTQAHAQNWTFADNRIVIPAPLSGSGVEGALMTCRDALYFLTLLGVSIGDGSSATPVALLVDRSVFATTADPAGVISVSDAAVGALKSGNRVTISYTSKGNSAEATFTLRGSSRALEALATSCPSAGADEETVPEAVASMEFAPTVSVGEKLAVTFEGPADNGEWIGFATTGSAANYWIPGFYVYTSDGSPGRIKVPAAYGTYEIRYVTADYKVLAAKPVQVTGRAPSISAPASVSGAARFSVDFSGPGSDAAFISIARPGDAPATALGKAGVFSAPAPLRAPPVAGTYEVRFVADGKTIVASQQVEVGEPPKVTLQPMTASPGETISIEMPDAPRYGGDYIYLARAGSPDSDYGGGYVGVPSSGAASIAAPQESGAWEIRYVVPFGSQYVALGRAPLTVKQQ